MRVFCHKDDELHARDAGHLPVSEDPEAIYFHEAPPDEDLVEFFENATMPIIIEADGCSVETNFRDWAAGWLARGAQHRRKTRAGLELAKQKGYSPRRPTPARTEAFVRSLLEMGLSMAACARKAKIDPKTVRRIKEDMENGK